MDVRRHRVIREAESWIGTPYVDGARLKFRGVDCGQFVAAVFEACGWGKIELPPYKALYFMNKENTLYEDMLEKFASRTESNEPGNIALYRVGRSMGHGCIIVDWPLVIHARDHGCVEYTDITQGRLTMGKKPVFYDPYITRKP